MKKSLSVRTFTFICDLKMNGKGERESKKEQERGEREGEDKGGE